ncbi:hypothetical protein GCM10012275_42940 [Longimycelium tulufanense]|uniref:Methyltransferase domain-containing protein n=1 Tax=Longimycelium tulufanense TaxID=907463 RepID=A0A8J3CB09_9PSEU|nr:class I SAM-dependent methyltransferase [Longimycelium tulufanense]GGM67753.1 hypothetical protein GCM10012275_42940 [Longimycelium tulufanense]
MTGLASSNIAYRDPELYDRMRTDDHAVVDRCVELIDQHGPPGARTLVDFGCGTGRDLDQVSRRFDGTGVDLNPAMVNHAHERRPHLDVRLGDMRNFRLGHTVDVLLCLGNSMAYLHSLNDLQAAVSTFAAHAHPGTLLVIETLISAVPASPPRTSDVEHGGIRAEVTVSTEWNLRKQISTTHRTWRFTDGRCESDHLCRRVIFPREMDLLLGGRGFEILSMSNPRDDQELRGPGALVAARYTALTTST